MLTKLVSRGKSPLFVICKLEIVYFEFRLQESEKTEHGQTYYVEIISVNTAYKYCGLVLYTVAARLIVRLVGGHVGFYLVGGELAELDLCLFMG